MARILIVDDDAQIREMLAIFLERNGYEVVTAADGGKAYQIIGEQTIDVVITDIVMPEHEGFETIRRIRHSYPDTGIIAMSGGGHIPPEHYLAIAKRLGARGTFFKPVDCKQLLAMIRDIV